MRRVEQGIFASRRLLSAENTNTLELNTAWVWPLPRIADDLPSISRTAGKRDSNTVQIGYQTSVAPSSPVPVLAPRDGVVAYAASTAAGAVLCLHHSGGWSTEYEGLAKLAVSPTDRFRRGSRVRAGSIVGHLQHPRLRVQFSLNRLTEQGLTAVDPGQHVPRWSLLSWSDTKPCAHMRRAG
jgi:peptidase M23-like protein